MESGGLEFSRYCSELEAPLSLLSSSAARLLLMASWSSASSVDSCGSPRPIGQDNQDTSISRCLWERRGCFKNGYIMVLVVAHAVQFIEVSAGLLTDSTYKPPYLRLQRRRCKTDTVCLHVQWGAGVSVPEVVCFCDLKTKILSSVEPLQSRPVLLINTLEVSIVCTSRNSSSLPKLCMYWDSISTCCSRSVCV